jgi:excisionase family DNA binding protein
MPDLTQPAEALTTRQAAAYLSVSVTTVQGMVERGELSAWRTSGGHRRISTESVMVWIEARFPVSHRPGVMAPAPGAAPERAPLRVLHAGVGDSLIESLVAAPAAAVPSLRGIRAADALDALLLAERFRPHLLIAAVALPPIGAFELLCRLRAHAHFSQMLAVILIPEDGVPDDLLTSRPGGCVCWPIEGVADRISGLVEGLMTALRR